MRWLQTQLFKRSPRKNIHLCERSEAIQKLRKQYIHWLEVFPLDCFASLAETGLQRRIFTETDNRFVFIFVFAVFAKAKPEAIQKSFVFANLNFFAKTNEIEIVLKKINRNKF